MAAATCVVALWGSAASAGTSCVLPEAYPIALEARGTLLGTGRGVVAVEQPSASAPLKPGDAVRQANGASVETCDDVEGAAAEAFARGLPLLLAVERPEGLVPVLVSARDPREDDPPEVPDAVVTESPRAGAVEAASVGATRDAAVAPAMAVAEQDVPASARALAVVSPSAPVSNDVLAGAAGEAGDAVKVADEASREASDIRETTARPNGSDGVIEPALEGDVPAAARAVAADARREPRALPQDPTVAGDLRSRAQQAVALLRKVEARATVSVPMAIYDLERQQADTAMREIDFGTGDAAASVRGVAFDVLAAYQTASDILAAKLEYQVEARRKMRTRAPREMPYFSDGDVPEWVAAYPFLQEAVLAPPKDRRFLQSSGRWSPDRAVELLWEYAGDETTRLAGWSAGD